MLTGTEECDESFRLPIACRRNSQVKILRESRLGSRGNSEAADEGIRRPAIGQIFADYSKTGVKACFIHAYRAVGRERRRSPPQDAATTMPEASLQFHLPKRRERSGAAFAASWTRPTRTCPARLVVLTPHPSKSADYPHEDRITRGGVWIIGENSGFGFPVQDQGDRGGGIVRDGVDQKPLAVRSGNVQVAFLQQRSAKARRKKWNRGASLDHLAI